MKFKLEIELGNDAMQTGLDVADALDEVIAAINTDGPFKVGETDPIRDENGNTVGKWEVIEPWASYVNGTAGRHFATLTAAVRYFSEHGMTLKVDEVKK